MDNTSERPERNGALKWQSNKRLARLSSRRQAVWRKPCRTMCNARNKNIVDGRKEWRKEKRKEPCEDTICNCGVGHALNIAVDVEFNLCCDIGHCDGKESKKTNVNEIEMAMLWPSKIARRMSLWRICCKWADKQIWSTTFWEQCHYCYEHRFRKEYEHWTLIVEKSACWNVWTQYKTRRMCHSEIHVKKDLDDIKKKHEDENLINVLALSINYRQLHWLIHQYFRTEHIEPIYTNKRSRKIISVCVGPASLLKNRMTNRM